MCLDSVTSRNYGVGATYSDDVGLGWCSDEAELTFTIATVATALTIIACGFYYKRGATGIACGAAFALALTSTLRLVYGAPVLLTHPHAAPMQSRQLGVPIITSVLSWIYSVSSKVKYASSSDNNACCLCAAPLILDVINALFSAWAWSVAFWHPRSATAAAYVTFDALGIALAFIWIIALGLLQR